MATLEERLSPEYYKRKEMMVTFEVPTISDVKNETGPILATIIFEETPEELREDFGLTPYLEGPQGDLWVSPSDLLIGKVVLKPPLTQKHLQALTHEGIMELGFDVEQRFLLQMEKEKEEALLEKQRHLEKLFEAQMEEFKIQLLKEEAEKYGEMMDKMKIYYENKIAQLIWECYEQVEKIEEQMRIEADSLNFLWKEKLDYEIQETVYNMTKMCLQKMRKQEHVLIAIFTKRLKILEMKHKCRMEKERRKHAEMLEQMKHNLYCQNISNLMYLLCKERRKCSDEKNEVVNEYSSKIAKQKSNLSKKMRLVSILKKSEQEKIKKLSIRERCLIEILRQFRKFIYFALKASPTQGEFLLNIEKLIKFELDDYCLPPEQVENENVDKNLTVTIEVPIEEQQDEILKFLRNRDQNLSEEFEYNDDLPAFYFNENLYVREDFRDLLTSGKEIDKKPGIWNADVEELIKIFQKTVEEKKLKSCHVDVPEGPNFCEVSKPLFKPEMSLSLKSGGEQQSKKNSIGSKRSMEVDDEKEIRRISLSRESPVVEERKICSIEGSLKSQEADAESRSQFNASFTQSRLTLARDSIILHISNIERKSIQMTSKLIEDSLSKASDRGSLKKFSDDDDDDDNDDEEEMSDEESSSKGSLIKKTMSKLLMATDSYEIIKSSMNLSDKKDKSESRRSTLTFDEKIDVMAPSSSKKPTKGKRAKPKPSPKKAQPKARIAGCRGTKYHEQPINEFTDDRIKDLVKIMKDDPNLMKLFTS